MKLKSIAIQVKLDSLFELSISNMYFSEFFLLKCLGFMSFQWLSTHPTQQHSFLVSSKVKKNNMDKGLNLGLLFPRQRWSQVCMFTSFVYCKLLKIEISTGVKFSLYQKSCYSVIKRNFFDISFLFHSIVWRVFSYSNFTELSPRHVWGRRLGYFS